MLSEESGGYARYPKSSLTGGGIIRNVQVMVQPKQGSKGSYVPTKPIYLDRHVSNLVVVVAADDHVHEEDGDAKVVPEKALGELHHLGPS